MNGGISAALRASDEGVPCIVKQMTDREAHIAMFKENEDRSDVPPMDLAAFVETVCAEDGLTQQEFADSAHRDPSTISNLMRVYHNEFLCEKVRAKELSLQAALELLSAKAARRQSAIFRLEKFC